MDDTRETPLRPTAMTIYQPPAFLVPQDIAGVKALAQLYVEADWVPRSYRNRDGTPNLAKVEVGIMHGMELGLRPLAALQSIAVINGMPCVWGDGMLALCEDSGLLADMKESFEGEGEQIRAVCQIVRRGRATPISEEFSVAMAKKANLWSKDGPWQNYPSRMLRMRARAWALRAAFADVLRGVRSAEEVQDYDGIDLMDVTPPRPQLSDFNEAARPAATAKPADGAKQAAPVAPAQQAQTASAPPDYEIVDHEGVVHQFAKAAEAQGFFDKAMRFAAHLGSERLEGLWETNAPFLADLRQDGKSETADMLNRLYGSILQQTQHDEKEKAKAAPPAAQERAAPRSRTPARTAEAQATGAEPAVQAQQNGAGAEWTPRESSFFKQLPTSPLKEGGSWLYWTPWAVEQIQKMDASEVDSFEAKFAAEFAALKEKRPQDYAAFRTSLDAKKGG